MGFMEEEWSRRPDPQVGRRFARRCEEDWHGVGNPVRIALDLNYIIMSI